MSMVIDERGVLLGRRAATRVPAPVARRRRGPAERRDAASRRAPPPGQAAASSVGAPPDLVAARGAEPRRAAATRLAPRVRRRRPPPLRIADVQRSVAPSWTGSRRCSTSSAPCSPTPATSWRWSAAGPRRDARPAAQRPRLHHLGAARRHRAAARAAGPTRSWDMGRDFGTIGCRKGAVAGRDHDVPLRGLRPRLAQAGGRLRRHPRGRPGPPRLHRQRDGGAAAGPRVRGPVRRRGRPGRSGCCAPRARRRTPSPTTRCG